MPGHTAKGISMAMSGPCGLEGPWAMAAVLHGIMPRWDAGWAGLGPGGPVRVDGSVRTRFQWLGPRRCPGAEGERGAHLPPSQPPAGGMCAFQGAPFSIASSHCSGVCCARLRVLGNKVPQGPGARPWPGAVAGWPNWSARGGKKRPVKRAEGRGRQAGTGSYPPGPAVSPQQSYLEKYRGRGGGQVLRSQWVCLPKVESLMTSQPSSQGPREVPGWGEAEHPVCPLAHWAASPKAASGGGSRTRGPTSWARTSPGAVPWCLREGPRPRSSVHTPRPQPKL